MAQNTNSISAGFPTLLLITFIILKLCNVIAWSWFWVLSPFWIPLGIAAICLLIYLVFMALTD